MFPPSGSAIHTLAEDSVVHESVLPKLVPCSCWRPVAAPWRVAQGTSLVESGAGTVLCSWLYL